MPLLDVPALRRLKPRVIAIGSHPAIIQSMLDFDYLEGRSSPSILCIIASGRHSERYFFGSHEILLPVYESLELVPKTVRRTINLALVLTSGRRALVMTKLAVNSLPKLVGLTIFAEQLPERHALELADLSATKNIWMIGGASVGLFVTNHLKLGAIGGIEARQLQASNLFYEGHVAVISTSGGMVNEIIRMVANSGFGISFAVGVGGERFPILTPRDAFLAAEHDTQTHTICYFGELGGQDEYMLATMLSSGEITKPVIAYVAGTVAELFESPPQFGHAKAIASTASESARAKRKALAAAGAYAAPSFKAFAGRLKRLDLPKATKVTMDSSVLQNRQSALITSSISYDEEGEVRVLGQNLLELADRSSFAAITLSMFLGKRSISSDTEQFVDYVLRLLVDHGPYVSGAVNTIITARAGRDLVSSLASGLLTIGPRFGGAINSAAAIWLEGVAGNVTAAALVEDYASKKQYISGIGHRKYRVDNPDPRVLKLLSLVSDLKKRSFTSYALQVEAETVQKKGNLILNIDGVIAAGLLDLLHEKEGYTIEQLRRLIDVEFFNALFVLSRSVGFMAHYFDQQRIDEGLFRLGDDQVTKSPLDPKL